MKHLCCLHPHANNENCSGKIVKAHTIQRNGGLTKIAQEGHVYTAMSEITNVFKNDGIINPRKIGINEASTFTGFCGKHDNEIFKPIENDPFKVCEEYAFLLGYRALCREYYAKELASTINQNHLNKLFEATPVSYHDNLRALNAGFKVGLRDLEFHKERYDEVFLSKSYNEVAYYIILIEETPEIMCSGAFQPDYDINGIQLQNYLEFGERGLDLITYSVIATDSGGAIVFCWLNDSNACECLVDSIDNLKDQQLASLITSFTFTYFENTCFSIEWWSCLSDRQKEILEQCMNVKYPLPKRSDFLDINHTFVNWNTVSRNKKFK